MKKNVKIDKDRLITVYLTVTVGGEGSVKDVNIVDGIPSQTIYVQKSLKLDKQLIKIKPKNVNIKSSLSSIFANLGDCYMESNTTKAKFLYEQSLEIRLDLLNENHFSKKENIFQKRNLFVIYNKLGDYFYKINNFEKTEKMYLEALKIISKLTQENSKNLLLLQSLSLSYKKMGDLSNKLNHLEEAESMYLKSMKIRNNLTTISPRNQFFLYDLFVISEHLASLYVHQSMLYKEKKDYKTAIIFLEKAIKKFELLKALKFSDSGWRIGLYTCYLNLARLKKDKIYINKAIDIVNEIKLKNELYESDMLYLKMFQGLLTHPLLWSKNP